MSLSLELCKQLKAAGFPQGEHTTMWIGDTNYCCDFMHAMTNKPYPGSKCSMREMNMVACPNSDELIAQIQAEWPDIEYLCDNPDTERNTWEIDYTVDVDDDWHLAEGATLAESLANLYIALMKESA